MSSLRRLRHAHAGELELFCAHDPVEFEHITGRSMHAGAEPRIGDMLAHPG